MNVDWIIIIAGISNLLISLMVWKSNPKAKLNIYFGLFGFITFIQILFDFIFRFVPTLFILRCSYAFAALIPIMAIPWLYEICDFHIRKKWIKLLLFLPGIAFFIISFMDGLIVKEIKGLSILGFRGVLGPFFYFYTFYFVIYVISFAILLYRSLKNSDRLKKIQLKYILCGMLLYAGSATIFSLVLPTFFNIYDFTLLDAPSFIFFVGFTGYAITKHHLFDVKVIATELLTFVLWIILLIKIFLSAGTQDIILNSIILMFVVFFGVLLIRSVTSEVKQKEQMEKMAKDMEKAYEVEKKARQELEALDTSKNQFLLTIQHHLRTPLTAIMGYSDLILNGAFGKTNVKVSGAIKKIQIRTDDLIKMVNEFLDITQFQLGKEVISLKPDIQAEEIVEETIEGLKFEADKKGIYLKLEKPASPMPPIKADREKLKAALYNVIDNAVKYTTKGGVNVKVEITDTKKFKISVFDTGIGIGDNRAEGLFNKTFERGEEAKKTFATGRGIGLFLAGQIVKSHNGKIWAESEGSGKGSQFYIELPLQ